MHLLMPHAVCINLWFLGKLYFQVYNGNIENFKFFSNSNQMAGAVWSLVKSDPYDVFFGCGDGHIRSRSTDRIFLIEGLPLEQLIISVVIRRQNEIKKKIAARLSNINLTINFFFSALWSLSRVISSFVRSLSSCGAVSLSSSEG